MGIFNDQKKSNSQIVSTKNFYFGAPEAEGENRKGFSILEYFEDFLGVLDELERGKFIFTGRKGVGKSAIAKFIKDKSDNTFGSHASLLRISDLNLEKSIQDSHKFDENLIFEWLILIQLVKHLIESETIINQQEHNKLKKFLENNAGIASLDKYEFVEGIKKNGGEVSFGILSHVFGGIVKKYFDVKITRAPFYKFILPLKEIINTILSYQVCENKEFWILFDDLDISYDVSSKDDNDNLISLLRVAKNYNNEVFRKGNAKVLVFLREDMRNIILSKYPDSAKLFASYEININWYSHFQTSSNLNENPLKKLADKRIKVNFENFNIHFTESPWDKLISKSIGMREKSSFKYILDFTFYRPRDIISFLSMVSKEHYKYPIELKDIRKILSDFIDININEIRSELSLYFNEIEKNILFDKIFPFILRERDRNRYVEVEDLIEKMEEYSFSLPSAEIINILLDYSLIIYMNSVGELYFNYRENNLGKNSNRLYLTLPKGVYHFYNKLH